SNRLGMDCERTEQAASKLRSEIEVLCVLAAQLPGGDQKAAWRATSRIATVCRCACACTPST
ncbi:MAG: hypothetical protein ACYS0F_11745, partial [Planctomycetota bacterium]